ncbi:ABC transporter ATP-binding protein [Streptomyces sp. NPDC057245]|uniref:ABC transporter ATP-binding protein n=1 Tax=Streptomyces TaxID=1883 RepID=UPI001C1DDBC0|nr:ATP-binding cassette domain-containing protein [Streptomyces sp. A108]MBU6531886.1 ABC transporter ATP-binding protein [Streptomyces sp. A108]
MNLVEVADLSLSSAERTVLSDCSLTLRPGERVGLVGRSGSGKTALAHALLGYTRPGLARVGGTVRIAGHDPFAPGGARRVRGRLAAYVPQDCASALPAEHRVGRVLDRAARRSGVARAHLAAFRRNALEQLGLPPELAHAFPHQISGGQAQRVALASALAAGAELIVLDEPTSGLDPGTTEDLIDLLRTSVGDAAMLVVSHDLDVVDRLTHRRVAMTHGRLADAGDRGATAGLDARLRPSEEMRDAPAAEGKACVLRVEGVRGGPGGRPVLREVDLTLDAGECVAVMGASGAGKTTLARALAGMLEPSGGRLWLNGAPQPWSVVRRPAADRLSVALVDQDSRAALNPRETVGKALERARRAAARGGLTPPPAADLLSAVSLPASAADRRPDELSGGERQRASLARAVAAGPRVLLCDEVTASLDGVTERDVLDMLAALRGERGLAVLLITHSRSVAATADRCLVLADGILGPPATLRLRPDAGTEQAAYGT